MERQIIVVTRDAQFQNALRRVCGGQGCRVETAVSVAAALETAARMPVCVMVADASVEDVGDGAELARAIHQQQPDSTCFLIVDEDSVELPDRSRDEAWLHVVHKPIRMLQLAADVVDAIAECGAGD